MRYFTNTCSSMLKFSFFCENLSFWVKNAFFTISENKICKERLFYGLESSIPNFRAIYPQIRLLSPLKIFDYSKYL